MQISVIIVNYNVRPFLENALVSIRKALDGMEGEILVVDNGSDDGSVDMLRTNFSDVQLIANDRNVGFAAANNLALRKSTGRYILLINPDTVVQEDTLRVMVNFFEENADVGLAGCKVLNPEGTLQLACRRSFPTPWVAFTKITGLSSLLPNSKFFGRYNLTYLNPNESYEVDAVSGSFMFLRRKVYEQTDGLDEQFFMYGEDLDWCYRIQQCGWKIYYVPTTQIIHYKGESVKRSDIDELRLFYDAMHLFVKKHLSSSWIVLGLIRAGIVARSWTASLLRLLRPFPMVALDWFIVVLSLIAAEYFRVGEIFEYPSYAYPAILLVPGALIAFLIASAGGYTLHRFSGSRCAVSVFTGYIILSALTFFFKEYAFSRMIVIYSGMISFVLVPGWRIVARTVSRSMRSRKSLWGSKTLIVGTGDSGIELLQKLRQRIAEGYTVVGFIDVNRKRLGEKIAGVEILGSIDNIGKVIREHKISEVIFSTDSLSYMDILAVIGRSYQQPVNFKLVPSSREVIIGKTRIDQLNDIPLVDIHYNIDRPLNRITKRFLDLVVGLLLFITVLPLVKFLRMGTKSRSPFAQNLLVLSKVLDGSYSLVGRPFESSNNKTTLPHAWTGRTSDFFSYTDGTSAYLGKIGLTGLVQLNEHELLTHDEAERYNLYYAKNQSVMLDAEILAKSLINLFKKREN